MKNYTLYCSADNTVCRLAKSTLTAHKIAFNTVTLGKKEKQSGLAHLIGQSVSSLPQIFYGAEYVGDFNDIQKQFGAF